MQLRQITECSCDVCKAMCKVSPCMGTPEDIQKIIDAGYKDKLLLSLWVDPKNPETPMPAIAPINGPHGCVFQDKSGLCELHAAGLKPTEGKLAIHDTMDNGLRRTIGYTWISEAGISVLEQFTPGLAPIIREMIPFVKQGAMIQLTQTK